MRFNARRKAAFVVARWLATHDYPAEALPEGPDRAFVQDVVFTTVRRFRPLRAVLGQLLKTWPKGELEALVLVGAAQILYMPEVPDYAAVDETVEAAKQCENRAIAKVVNGVLRNLLRRRAEFEAYLAAAPLAERESFPNALVKRWTARWGAAGAEALARRLNEPAETWLAWRPGTNPAGDFVKLPRGTRVVDADGFAEGAFIVQDPATRQAVELLAVKPGVSVLDWCAAPGGKTIQIAWRQGAGDRLVAHEVNPRRVKRLEENLKRVGVAATVVGQPPETADGRPELFDRVLVDAPCSNTGVLRRKPDARWNWTPEKMHALAKLQGEILAAAARHVAPGGRLVYSTCSNEPEEDGDVAAAFLAAHPDFAEVERRECAPHLDGCDGAFACAFVRRREMTEEKRA